MSLLNCGKYTVSTSHQTYSVVLIAISGSERPLPRAQRRGGVIILGMLALAKRSVAADRVETLVKIGLGKLGRVSRAMCMLKGIEPDRVPQVDLTLAKYTCIALQRLNGSAKKVKGEHQTLL